MTNTAITLVGMLAAFRSNIAESEKLIADGATGYALGTEDATMVMCQDAGSTIFRLNSPLSPRVELFMEKEEARAACRNWNRQLTPDQRKAGCVLAVDTYEDVLLRYIETQRKLVTILAANSK
jgi:hypothetical protein